MRRSLLLAALLVLATAQAGIARAEPTAEHPRSASSGAELKRAADALVDAKRFDEALALYDQAYAKSPDPAIHYNRGRTLQFLGRYPEALDAFERFAREAPAPVRARVPDLDGLIADVRASVTSLVIRCRVDGARVIVRERVVGTTPITTPIALNAGPATVEVTAEGYAPYRARVDLPGGRQLALDAPLVATAGERKSASLDPAAHAPLTTRWWFWTIVGVGVVGGVALTAALLTERTGDSGNFTPGRASAPLVRF